MWILIVGIIFSITFTRAQDVGFLLDPIGCNNGAEERIMCDHNAHDDGQGHITMTADSRQDPSLQGSTGYVFFKDRVRMKDPVTGQGASFSTNFTFQITRAWFNTSGDGISFVMYSNASYRGVSGGTLGVYYRSPTDVTYRPGIEGTKTFCVEFDTYLNPGLDPSDNHIGVDLETIHSKVTAEAGSVGINLTDGFPKTAWIDYDSSSSNLEVRIANFTSSRPRNALISYLLNISNVVDEFMSVGIAASTGGQVEYHDLYSWSFEAFGLPPPTVTPSLSPSSSPAFSPSSPYVQGVSKSKTGLVVGVSAGASLLLLCCIGAIVRWIMGPTKCEKSPGDECLFELPMVDIPVRFTYKQLSVATNGFSEKSKLGEGGSSSVYRGVIASTGTLVAVKRVAKNSKQGEKEFLAEINVVSRLRHRNLVKLLGWCSDRGKFLLVYELMPNGSLDKLLFESGSKEILTWAQRVTIVKGVAAGLGYLHDGYVQQVIHRDIKSSNVMLDEEFNARVGDFGLARLIEHSKNLETTQLAGTIGYIAPEAVLMWKSTVKTDVYAFGALTLEVACGRRPIESDAPQDEMILVDWVWNLHAGGKILTAADARLGGSFPAGEMEHILLVGLLCSHPDPDARPSMRQVELILDGVVPLPAIPPSKPVPVYSSASQGTLKKLMTGKHSNSYSSGSLFTISTNSSHSIETTAS
ncbi:unnamed protein product [Calypogeia fissa]